MKTTPDHAHCISWVKYSALAFLGSLFPALTAYAMQSWTRRVDNQRSESGDDKSRFSYRLKNVTTKPARILKQDGAKASNYCQH